MSKEEYALLESQHNDLRVEIKAKEAQRSTLKEQLDAKLKELGIPTNTPFEELFELLGKLEKEQNLKLANASAEVANAFKNLNQFNDGV